MRKPLTGPSKKSLPLHFIRFAPTLPFALTIVRKALRFELLKPSANDILAPSRELLVLIFQLRDFYESNHSFATAIDDIDRHLISRSSEGHLRPPLPRPAATELTKRDQRQRERSQSLGDDWLQPTWPAEWAVDKTAVRTAIKSFRQQTQEYRQQLERPASPFNSPTRTATKARTPSGSPTKAVPTRTVPQETMANNLMTFSNDQFQQLLATLQRQPATPPATTSPAINTQFKARDIGFFDPNNDVDSVEIKEGKTIYHNVFLFIERLRVKKSLLDQNITT